VKVVLEQPERQNLLGLFMKAALEARAERVERARPSGDIALTAGRMSVTLSFSPEGVTIRKGVADRPRAHLKGSLGGLIEVARGRAVAPFLRRRVRISGNPLALLPLSRVFRKER
jgi:SCP-2 sterol transfer family protein